MKIDVNDIDVRFINNKNLGLNAVEEEILQHNPDLVAIKPNNYENMRLLEECRADWDSLRDFRKRRKRNRNYYRGKQWSDLIEDPQTGEMITEEQYIKNQGKVPLKQNQVRQYVKNLIGQFLSNPSKTVVLARSRAKAKEAEMLSNALHYVQQINQAKKIDARNLEEFTLSGAPICKVTWKYWKERNIEDVYIQKPNPQRIGFNSDLEDPRLHDMRRIFEIMDLTIDEIVSGFANSPEEEQYIRAIYAKRTSTPPEQVSTDGLSNRNIDSLDFYTPRDPNKCRLYEIWEIKSAWRTYVHDTADGSYNIVEYSLEEIKQFNEERIQKFIDNGMAPEDTPLMKATRVKEQFWYCKFLTPDGHVLWEGESPYAHQSHPYALTLYPLVDGEVWGFIEDILDQQRYINRLITLMDFIIGSSAKGVLMVPEDALGDKTPEEFSEEWVKFNGVIVYKPGKHNHKPEQVTANSTNIGINELLHLQMQFLDEISGIHGAIQGQQPKSGTPSSRYAQEAQNASINTMDYFNSFNQYIQQRDLKVLKTIVQFYQEERYLAVSGREYDDEARVYDPEKVRDLDFDLLVTQGTDTPIYRQFMDDMLMQLLERQQIDVEMYLEHTSAPFADKLLDTIRRRKEEMQQGLPPGTPPEVAQAAQAGDPKALEMINQMLQTGQGQPQQNPVS